MRKLKSVKVWVTVFSMALLTFIVVTNRSEFSSCANLLCGVPLAYIGANVAQKKIEQEKSPEQLDG